MKILFLGGNGNISWYCTKKALDAGHEVWALSRSVISSSTRRQFPDEVKKIIGDIRDKSKIKGLIKNLEFDVVCDFICYNENDAKIAIDVFREKTSQYIYISSEAVYKRSSKYLPFKENCPKNDPKISCEYISGKIMGEEAFMQAFSDFKFPITIVRPAYTYDTIVPVPLGGNCFTAPQRFIEGKPILMAGNGTNIWTFTHSRDFAEAFIGLVGNSDVIGEDFHITSDEWLTWNEMMSVLLNSLGVKNPRYIYVPFEDVLECSLAGKQSGLLFQRMWHNIYDNTKIKKTIPSWRARIPFEEGILETIKWLYERDTHRRIVKDIDDTLEQLTIKYGGKSHVKTLSDL
jgi:nucleoside-diphosphate-sugar epimerase